MNFQTLLKKQTRESVYIDTDPNHMFTFSLCIFLNIFQDNFLVKYRSKKENNNFNIFFLLGDSLVSEFSALMF
jgi:hypothetical protein